MELLEDLYNGKKQINVHLSDKPYVFHLVLLGRDNEPDFMLSSFGANLWCRSNKGINRQKYASLRGIKIATKKLIKKKIETNGKIKFSITDTVYPF